MSYGFDITTVDNDSDSKFIQAGIKKGIFLKEVKFVPATESANAYMEVVCENKEGQTVNRRYFEPKLDGKICKSPEDVDKAVKKFAKVVANLTRRFLGDAYAVPAQPSFETFCKKVITDLYTRQAAFATTELRTKIVLNTSGYPTLPSYAPIWENVAVVADEQSKLQINPDFDVVDRAGSSRPAANTASAPMGTVVDEENPF